MSLDTAAYVKRLEASGYDRKLAEAHARALAEQVEPQLVTKTDLDAMESRMRVAQQVDLATSQQTIRDLNARISELETRLVLMVLGQTVAFLVLIVALLRMMSSS